MCKKEKIGTRPACCLAWLHIDIARGKRIFFFLACERLVLFHCYSIIVLEMFQAGVCLCAEETQSIGNSGQVEMWVKLVKLSVFGQCLAVQGQNRQFF